MSTFEITIRCCADGSDIARLAAEAEHALENGPFRAAQTVTSKMVAHDDPRQPELPGMEGAR